MATVDSAECDGAPSQYLIIALMQRSTSDTSFGLASNAFPHYGEFVGALRVAS
jgi:hypothetical protein